MGILDRLSPTAQFIEVIEWLDDSSDTMLYRFPVRDQEIKNGDRKSTRLNSSHDQISYAVFCLKKKKKNNVNISRIRAYYHEYIVDHAPESVIGFVIFSTHTPPATLCHVQSDHYIQTECQHCRQ